MIKRNLKLLTALLAVVLVAGVGIFYACKKTEELKETPESIFKTGDNPTKGIKILIVEVSDKGYKGEGHGQDKHCVPGNKRCWLWIWAPVPSNPNSNSIVAFVDDATALNSANKHITLFFSYEEYNDSTKVKSQDFFNFEKDMFILEEDIVEEKGSDLLEFFDISSSCTIPAGSYPIYKFPEGIKVKLPVIIK